jgi:hypothetical protein
MASSREDRWEHCSGSPRVYQELVRGWRATRRAALDAVLVSQLAWFHMFHCYPVEWDLRVGSKPLLKAAERFMTTSQLHPGWGYVSPASPDDDHDGEKVGDQPAKAEPPRRVGGETESDPELRDQPKERQADQEDHRIDKDLIQQVHEATSSALTSAETP